MDKIIEHFGSRSALARALGVERAAVTQWLRFGLPPARAIEIERLTGGLFKATDIEGIRGNDVDDQNISA